METKNFLMLICFALLFLLAGGVSLLFTTLVISWIGIVIAITLGGTALSKLFKEKIKKSGARTW